ncbi:MAG: T9SS type A sorting domain-containing protein [Bacteroidales bacterium]|jgi:uncharacterized protein YrzB (UPF0473 family)|nr:T9SS type A sorting domain-containing protein [Bacteroidales bacterium]
MKKNLFLLSIVSLFFLAHLETLVAQNEPVYQLINAGFEAWHRELKSGTNLANSIVPTGFNSFYSGSGGMIGTASAKRQDSTRDVRAGATGVHSLVVYNNSVLGVRANGNVTTGRINAANISASDQSNHNYTDHVPLTTFVPDNPPKFCQQITGTPDSLRFWVKYLPSRAATATNPNKTDKGRIRVYIHGTGVCRDAPAYPAGMNEIDLYYGKAMAEFYKEDGGWNCYQVPFEYNGTNTVKNTDGNYYVLLSMTSNSSPGGGANGTHATNVPPGISSYPLSNNVDYAFYDDIEFIYSAWLTDLRINGVSIDGFHKNLLTYGSNPLPACPVGECPFPNQPSDFSWTPEVSDIKGVVVTNVLGPDGDADGGYTSILVTAEDGITIKEYRVYYFTYRSPDNNLLAMSYTMDNVTGIPVPGFNASQTVYNITLTDPEEVRIPKIVETSIVLSDPLTAEIQRIEQPTGVNSKGMVVVKAENLKLKTYNLMFEKVKSANSKLNWIKIANVDIANFDADTLVYEHSATNCVTAIPAITYEKASAWATVGYIPATLTNRTATITVTAENGDVRVYKVNFKLTNNNTVMNSYRINTTNRANNCFTAANNYTDVFAASYTAPFTLSAHSTAAQHLACTGATAVFPTSTVWYPDTNRIWVTAQDLVTKQEYKAVIKNTNCYLKQTTGSNIGLKYVYNGVTRNITVPSASNNNDVIINVTIPVVGPNEPCILVEADPQAPVVDTIIYTQPEQREGNSGRVKVVANDQVGNKTYIVNFTPTISTDNTLSYLSYNGFDMPGFNPTTNDYLMVFPSTVTEVPLFDYAASFPWLPEENIVETIAPTLADTAQIAVTAESGAVRTYRIAFEVVPQEKDAYLVDVRYNNVSIPNFNPTIYDYLIDIPYSDPVPPQITVQTSSPTALPFFAVQQGAPLYTQKVLVFSEDMLVNKSYTLHFNRVKDTLATLADIKIDNISLPDFAPKVFEYEVELPYQQLTAPVVGAIPAFKNALVDIVQINSTTGTAVINVIAENENYTEVYTIGFTRELSPVKEIVIIEYEYNGEPYEVTCSGTVMTIPLPVETIGEPVISNIILADSRSSFEIDEQPDEINNLTGTVIVTAEDETEETYLIKFQRTLSESTQITGISYTLGSTTYQIEEFDPAVLTYYRILDFNNSLTPSVDASAAWVNTQIIKTQPTNPFGTGTILVISEDGGHNVTYTIVFLRKGDAHLVTLSYNLDGVSYPISNFSPTTFNYNINLPIATTSIPVLEYVLEDNRCDVVSIQQDAPNGTSKLKIITWNQDDSLTYTVNFTVLLSTEALLDSLFIDGIFVDNFNPNVFTYTYPQYEYGEEPIPCPVISGKTKYADATLEDTQISGYPGEAAIKVTAGNLLFTNTYTVSFSVEAGNNNYLQELTINSSPYGIFDKYTYFYKHTSLYGSTKIPIINGIPEDARASVEIIQAQQFGDTANIIVTAINGDVAIYKVLFVVDKNNNAYAKMIYIDWKPMEDFNGFVYEYTYILSADHTGEPFVTAETEDSNANWKPEVFSYIPLIKQIIVTAENGVEQNIYTISFTKENSIIHFDTETTIQVYPNPVSDILYFHINELRQSGYLEIYSLEGKKTDNHTLQEGINTIHIEHLPKGIYFYKIFSDRIMIGTGKFVKS